MQAQILQTMQQTLVNM
jgi:hypothetical protein